MPINLPCMSLDWGRKPEYPEETPEARGEHANSTHTAEVGIEPPTLECQLYFEMLPHQFSGDRAKIAFIISLLSGKACRWAESMWTTESPVMQSLDPFLVHFKDVFGTSTSALSVHDELFSLWQANRAIHDYTLHFHTLAASSGWNEVALLSAYRRGLNPKIRQQMAIYDDSMGLELFMLKAQHISQRLFAVSIEEGTPSDASSFCSSPAPEPMQTDQYRLLADERQRRLHQRLCLYCGENDHLLQTCPACPPRPTVSTIHISSTVATPCYHDAVVIHASRSFSMKVLFDSGSFGNFISSHLLSACKVPRQRNPTRYRITTIQGKPLGKGLVQWKMSELTLRIGCLHEETLSLLVLEESAVDVVLGRRWLAKHQPNIRWISGSIDQWSDYCLQHCLRSLPLRTPEMALLGSTTIESPVSSTQANLPGEYQDYQDVFTQMATTKMLPHRPWDCAIDLLPGAW
ncbi:hypothetical protein QTP70_025774 [Hemibagrus guttatus]|uniref:Retrotransposon gag domain-containing protein n=1 Tax=Hemibagrus guttatus TaxID=175788 RepID=A0AAE0UWM4_9TELE|nr:hypothetical protein QTP70_025774 [Hemibagrus guttatus]